MAMTKGGSVPNAGTPDAAYPAPTPHAAKASQQVYEAPTSGAGIGAGEAGTDTNPNATAGQVVSGEDTAHNNLGGGNAAAIEQPVMGDDSDVVFGAEHDQKGNTSASDGPLNYGGGTPRALDQMMGLQPGTGYGDVNAPVASADKGLDPGATGYGSAAGTGNQGTGVDRRVVSGESKTDGGWRNV